MPSEEQVPSRPGSTLPTVPASFCSRRLNSRGRRPRAEVRRRGGRDACCAELNVGVAGQKVGSKVLPGADEDRWGLRGSSWSGSEEKCSRILTAAHPPRISGAPDPMG